MFDHYYMYIPAKQSGIALPDDIANYDKKRYPHWHFLLECAQHCISNGDKKPLSVRVERARQISNLAAKDILSGRVNCQSWINKLL